MHLETPGLHAVWQASIRATAPIVDATGSSRLLLHPQAPTPAVKTRLSRREC